MTAKRPRKQELSATEDIEALVQHVIIAQAALEAALDGQVDAVFNPATSSSILLNQAQDALRQSEDRYHRLVSRIAAIIFELDASGQVLFVNDSITAITGYSLDDLQTQKLWSILCPGELHAQVNKLYTHFEVGDVNNYELTVIGKDGRLLILQLNSANVYRVDGTLDHVVGLAIDITLQKHSEQERQHLLEQLGAESQRTQAAALEAQRIASELDGIFTAIASPVVIYNTQDLAVRANPAAIAAMGFNPTGYSGQEIVRKLAIRHSDGHPIAIDELPRTHALHGMTTASRHLILTNQGGDEHSIISAASPIFENGEVSRVVVIWNDITEHEQTAKTLVERERLNRAILDSLTANIAVIDASGTIIATNESWDQFARENGDPTLIHTGVGRNYLTVTRSAAAGGDKDAQQAAPGILRVLDGIDADFSFEYPLFLTEQYWFLMRVTSLAGMSTGAVISHTNITDRKLAEEAVINSEKHFRSLIDRSADGLSLLSREGVILSEGPAAIRLWGRSTIGIRFLDNVHRDDLPRCVALLQGLMLHPDLTAEATFRMIHPDKTWRWIEASATNLLNEPSVQAIVVNYRDVTARKQAEEQLQQYATRLKRQHEIDEAILAARSLEEIAESVLHYIGNMVPCQGASITLLDFKTRELKVFTSTAQPGSAFPQETLIPFDTVGDISGLLDQLREGQSLMIEDIRTLLPSLVFAQAIAEGKRALFMVPLLSWGDLMGALNVWSTLPGQFKEQDQEVVREIANSLSFAIAQARLFQATRDYNRILEETVQERTLEVNRTKDHLEAVFNNSVDAIIVTDIKGMIQQINPAFAALFGYNAGEEQGKSVTMLAAPNYRERLAGVIETLINGSLSVQLEMYAERQNGTVFDAEISLSPIIGQDGTPTEIVCNLRDITAHKRVERDLQELNQTKTEFLSTAAHELRTPLTTIRGFSELLLTRQMDHTRQQHFIHLISQQSTQLGTILDDLLDISRLEAKRDLALTFGPIDMIQIVRDAAALYDEVAADHIIQIRELDKFPPLTGDPFRLAQVAKNLISNAVKYSPKGSEITILIQRIGHSMQISLQDHGMGMTSEQQSHLFEKFYRANTSNTGVSGTGLGLSICKTIIELHGGKIWANTEYGKGSTFYFTLPLPEDSRDALSQDKRINT